MSWHGRQLKEMEKTNSVIQFLYNADGIRTNKIVNGTDHAYTLHETQIVSEAWGSILLIYLCDDQNQLIRENIEAPVKNRHISQSSSSLRFC